MVAGRHAARIRRAHARSAVRGGGRGEARAAPLHAPLLQVRRRGLDGRPQAAGLRRRLRRFDGTGPADGGRLREHVPDLVSRQRVDRVLVCARRRLGHEDLLRSLRGGRRRGRAAQDHGLGRAVRVPRVVTRRCPACLPLRARDLRRPAARAAHGRPRQGRRAADPLCLPRPELQPLPARPRSGLGRRRDRVRGRGSRQQRPVPRLCGRLQLRRDPPRDRCHGIRRGRRRLRLHGLHSDDVLRALPGRRADHAADRALRLAAGALRAGAVHRRLQGRHRGRGLDRAAGRPRGGQALSAPPQHPRRAVHAVHDEVLRRVPGARRRRVRGRLLQPARLLRLQRGVGPRDSRAGRARPGLGVGRLRGSDGGHGRGAEPLCLLRRRARRRPRRLVRWLHDLVDRRPHRPLPGGLLGTRGQQHDRGGRLERHRSLVQGLHRIALVRGSGDAPASCHRPRMRRT